jgi:hypothetical protein
MGKKWVKVVTDHTFHRPVEADQNLRVKSSRQKNRGRALSAAGNRLAHNPKRGGNSVWKCAKISPSELRAA